MGPPPRALKEKDANTRTTGQIDTIDLTGSNDAKENRNPAKGKTNKSANTAVTAATSNPRKRKSNAAAQDDIQAIMFPPDAPEIDDDDPRLDLADRGDTCQKTRRKIHDWIESGAQLVGEFQREIGVSSKAYGSFMNRTGTWDGEGCDTYWKAALFFKKRELAGLPLKVPKAKKAKTASSGGAAKGRSAGKSVEELLDTGDIGLPGEDSGLTAVYMTCDEVRKAMRALLAKGVAQAALARALSGMYPAESGKKVSAANLRYFLGQKGPLGGNTSPAFWAGYCFFEKKRIKDGKPKSDFREDMEDIHGLNGVDVQHGANTAWVTASNNKQLVVDKYAKLRFM